MRDMQNGDLIQLVSARERYRGHAIVTRTIYKKRDDHYVDILLGEELLSLRLWFHTQMLTVGTGNMSTDTDGRRIAGWHVVHLGPSTRKTYDRNPTL
jgi:hypothetical protein